MEKNNFLKEMFRLKTEFGEKFYGDEKVRIIWDHVKAEPEFLFTEAVTELIGNSKFPPMLDQIVKAIDERKRKTNYKKPTAKQNCDRCASTGVLSAISHKHPGLSPFSFACPACENGPPAFRRWEERFAKSFTLIGKDEIPLEVRKRVKDMLRNNATPSQPQNHPHRIKEGSDWPAEIF